VYSLQQPKSEWKRELMSSSMWWALDATYEVAAVLIVGLVDQA